MTPMLIRFLILILIFAAVLLAVEGLASLARSRATGAGRINRRLGMIEAGVSRDVANSRLRRNTEDRLSALPGLLGLVGGRLESMLDSTGLTWSTRSVLLGLLAATTAIACAGLVFAALGGFVLTLGLVLMICTFAVAAGCGIPVMVLGRIADRRRRKMQEQFPVALDVFVRGLRAGHPVASALQLLTQEMSDPIGSEFGLVVDEVTYGAELRDALQNMADRWGLDDIHMFVVSLSVQSETGGNLAEILENLSRVIRERTSMLLKVRALSSEGRMTAVILTALPVLAFLGLFLVNPAFYLEVAQDPAFIVGYVILLSLYAIGFFTIRRMIDLKV